MLLAVLLRRAGEPDARYRGAGWLPQLGAGLRQRGKQRSCCFFLVDALPCSAAREREGRACMPKAHERTRCFFTGLDGAPGTSFEPGRSLHEPGVTRCLVNDTSNLVFVGWYSLGPHIFTLLVVDVGPVTIEM